MAQAVDIVRQAAGGPPDALVRSVAQAVFRRLRKPRAAVSVTFVADATMRGLNRRTRGKDTTTDVLAFPADEAGTPPFPVPDGQSAGFLGDVVVSLPEARRQAKERGLSQTVVVCELLIHGILHCAGFDHIRPSDAKKMLPLQQRLLTHVIATYVS